MTKNPVRLGLMPPLTGLVGIYGPEISRAGRIACQEVNESGGVLGRPLELRIEDDGSLPESAVAAATRLVGHHKCSAIIGNLLSNSRIAVAYRVSEPCRIPYLNFSFYEGSISSRYFFHFAALPNQQIDRMIPFMRAKYGPRMFFAGNNYEWPRGSIDAAKLSLARAGGEVVGEEYCPIGVDRAGIEGLLDRVEAAAPDVFVPYFAGDDQVNLLMRFTQRGLKGRMAVVMGHYDEIMASRLPPEVRDGFYSSNTYFMTVDTEENRKVLARLSAQPGVTGLWPHGNGILTNFGEGTYLCVKAFAQAANAAGSLHPEALIGALETIRLSSPQGTVRMDPARHHAAVSTYLSRCRADGVFAIVESFDVIDPVLPERYSHERISYQATKDEDIRLQARMLEQISDAVLLCSAQGGAIVYTNAGAQRMFGYGKGELNGKSVSSLYGESEGRTAEDIAGIMSRNGSWRGELQCIKMDGSLIWCSVTISSFTHPVHGEVWMAVHSDIAERKKAEEALRESLLLVEGIINAIPVRVFWKSRDLVYLGCNAAFARDAGFSSPSDVIGKDDFQMGWRDQAELYRGDDRKVIESGLPKLLIEEPQTTAEGNSLTLLTSKIPLRNAQGEIVGVLGTYLDITEHKQAGALLQNVQKLDSLGILAGGIAHDFNNILTAILGNISLIRSDSAVGADAMELAKEAQDACITAKGLAHQLLTFSKGGAPVIKTMDLRPVLSQATAFASRGSHCRCVLELGEGPLSVSVDQDQITQVIQNLILNASQAMPEGGDITIKARIVTLADGEAKALPAGRYVRVTVEDQGIGIRPAHIAKIFDPYFSTKSAGRGLGLSVCYSIMAKHSGLISVEPKPGKGTVFTLHFPAAADIPPGHEGNAVAATGHGATGHGRILIMDDEPTIAAVLKRMLARLGYRAESVADGKAALDAYKDAMDGGDPFAAVIVDLTIRGGMGGKETMAGLAALDRKAKGIVSSGYSGDTIMSEYASFDFCAALEKPYRLEDVSEVLRRVIGAKTG